MDKSTLSALEFDAYFKTPTTIESINREIQYMSPFVVSYVNNLLQQEGGYPITLPKDFQMFLKDYKIKTYNGYLFIDAAPNQDVVIDLPPAFLI